MSSDDVGGRPETPRLLGELKLGMTSELGSV